MFLVSKSVLIDSYVGITIPMTHIKTIKTVSTTDDGEYSHYNKEWKADVINIIETYDNEVFPCRQYMVNDKI